MPNFSYVIDSSFKPYSFQEMLAPIAMYKDEYEKVEDAYLNLSQKADKFKYLADSLDPDSKAADIYNGYANELKAQAEDLAKNGLSINNRRALTGLKRRYQGEIGLLDEAKTMLDKELELRRQLGAKDPTLLYADENLNIDKYLGNNRPNLYSVSGSDLFNKGALLGKNVSSRMYKEGDAGSTLGGYYRQWVSKQGVGPNEIAGFINSDAVQREVDKILQAEGVEDNLSDANYARARQQVLNGIYNGIVYQEKVNPVRDPGVMSAAEKASDERARQSLKLQQDRFNMEKREWEDLRKLRYTFDEEGNVTGLNPTYVSGDYEVDPNTGKLKKKSTKSTQSAEEKKAIADENKKGVAMLKLENGDLAHNEGFDVTFGENRHHYNYIGAISRHGNKWHHGAIGEDNPGHNFPGAWGWASTSNVENAWGNFSAEGVDEPAKMRVLSSDEFMRLVSSDQEILTAIEERCKAAGVDPTTADIQIVEVPNEKGGSGQNGYLIAVH